ncbi:head-tail adaptor protein [Aquitalea magnusonii]|uniref:SPP1 family predicted phage head-tail adaptor n=1 Tax=Aquitalea magnusonii TaxID=332411 RepID=A0A318JMR0_9NEIS|nr:head-tail adaptor protein [Aquitalea magnusonii]PXX49002.1 SPP1 family predicted phage head-tail adaptor [Aquitalea magnusonii]
MRSDRVCKGEIQQRVKGKNGAGESVDVWQRVGPRRWMDVRDLTGRERVGDSTNYVADARGFCSWVDGVDADMRVVWRGRTYRIVAPPIDKNGQRRDMELLLEYDHGHQGNG